MSFTKGNLQEILEAVGKDVFLSGNPCSITVRGISTDSRSVDRNHVFVAIPGTSLDGRNFIPQAISRGASALVVPREDAPAFSESIPGGHMVIGVDNPREYAGLMAGALFGSPSEKLLLAAVTGTNGKTTVSYLLEGILLRAGLDPGVIGTVSRRHRGREIPSETTTPGPVELQQILAGMLARGAGAAALEVSSHALDQDRIAGCRFAVSIFTNLTRDHLDYHGDMEAYFQAKSRLFTDYDPGTPVINLDDPYGRRLWEMVSGPRISFGFWDGADIRPETWHCTLDGTEAVLSTPRSAITVRSRLPGRHNLQNIMAAVAASVAMGIEPGHIQAGIESVRKIPGRLEPVDSDAPVTALVDYAHTPSALESVLKTLRDLKPERLIVICGCGGDRDRGKRPLMARAAASETDIAVFTSDNPRSEDPRAILEDMLNGLQYFPPAGLQASRAYVKAITSRRKAIFWAVRRLRPGDCLLVAGKGHETYQITGDRKVPFDDRKVIREALTTSMGKDSDPGLDLEMTDVIQATGADLLAGDSEAPVRGISTDSRTVDRDDLFVAISGKNFDGNDFVMQALEKGAAGAVVGPAFSRPVSCPGTILRVEDTIEAMGGLASWYRKQLGMRVVGITGSCGKTTTKDLLFSIIRNRWTCIRTIGNFNNLIGLPLSIFSARPGDRWAVLEMGMNRPGEIARLCEIARPSVGIITTIQPAHLEGMGSLEAVAGEKLELWKAIPDTGIAVVNLDDPLILGGINLLTCRSTGYTLGNTGELPVSIPPDMQVVRCRRWMPGDEGVTMEIEAGGHAVSISLKLTGRTGVQNALAAAAAAFSMGIDLDLVKKGLEEAKPAPGRLRLVHLGHGLSLLDDTYNANPASMDAALETLCTWSRGDKKIAVLGDMLELGERAADYHAALGRQAASAGLSLLVAVGSFSETVTAAAAEAGMPGNACLAFPCTADLLEWLEAAAPGLMESPATILIKGSRGIGLESAARTVTRLTVERRGGKP